MDTRDLLNERQRTHGLFADTAHYAQWFKKVFRDSPNMQKAEQREALDSIGVKIARILSGDPNCKEHWADIAGYAKLGEEACDG